MLSLIVMKYGPPDRLLGHEPAQSLGHEQRGGRLSPSDGERSGKDRGYERADAGDA